MSGKLRGEKEHRERHAWNDSLRGKTQGEMAYEHFNRAASHPGAQ